MAQVRETAAAGKGCPVTVPAQRLEALTGIRGLAAWYVVFYHIRYSLTDLLPAPVIAALGKGYLAVDLFFMLSGFVMWLNYAPRLAAGSGGAAAMFWWRRVARIWPLHAVVLTGFISLAAVFAATGRSTVGYPLRELPLHLLLIQNWGFTAALAWNHPAWSISAEMAAYLAFPLLVRAGMAERTARLPVAGLLGLAVLLLAGLHAIFAWHGCRRLGEAITSLGLARCLIEFMLGAVAARLWLAWHQRGPRPWLAGGLAVVTAACLIGGPALGLPETAFVPLALLAGLIALSLAGPASVGWLASGPVHWLGEVSYSTYLSHFGLFIVFKLLFVDTTLQLGVLQLAGFVGLLLVASATLYHGVETPAQRMLNALRWPRRVQSGPA